MSNFIDDFLRGQIDAEKGAPHVGDQSDAYDRGYETQYASEQVQSENSRSRDERIHYTKT